MEKVRNDQLDDDDDDCGCARRPLGMIAMMRKNVGCRWAKPVCGLEQKTAGLELR